MGSYLQAITQSFHFRGRVSRASYGQFLLWHGIIMSALVLAQSEKALLMYVLLTLPSVVSATRRRLHDSGHSSWWLLAGLLPVIGTLMLLLQLLRKGQPHHNRFGPNPRVWLE